MPIGVVPAKTSLTPDPAVKKLLAKERARNNSCKSHFLRCQAYTFNAY